ncbi:MAG: hypothetical protein U0O39_08545, partial [Akkermansia sp.]
EFGKYEESELNHGPIPCHKWDRAAWSFLSSNRKRTLFHILPSGNIPSEISSGQIVSISFGKKYNAEIPAGNSPTCQGSGILFPVPFPVTCLTNILQN